MSDAQRTMTGAEHCVYCGDFFECRDHVIPVRYNNVRRDYRRGSTVHCCNRCNGLLGSAAYFTVQERARHLIDRYRERNARDLTFPDWSEHELSTMAPKMRRTIRGRLAVRTLIRLKIDNLERVCLGIDVEPIDPLFVNGRRVVSDGVETENDVDGWGNPLKSIAERERVGRAEYLDALVRENYRLGVLFWRFARGPATLSVVNLALFCAKNEVTPDVPNSLDGMLALAAANKKRSHRRLTWKLVEVIQTGTMTLGQAMLRTERLVARGVAVASPYDDQARGSR